MHPLYSKSVRAHSQPTNQCVVVVADALLFVAAHFGEPLAVVLCPKLSPLPSPSSTSYTPHLNLHIVNELKSTQLQLLGSLEAL